MSIKNYKVGLENIFELFSSNEDLDGENNEVHIDFTQTPTYWIGMYKKLVLNHINFNKKVIKFFKESNEELDIEDVENAGEFVVYNRAWHYIQNVDINVEEHVIAIEKYTDEYLDTALKLGIHFFEEYEEYEKCALLKQILDKSKEILN
jgi:stress response protein YsnF|tara:strand:+ start:178 stop:624 length:447 start_codon:yes stop_codon:yes gene_type:complete